MTSEVYIAGIEHGIFCDSDLGWGLAVIMGTISTEASSYTLFDDQDPTHSASPSTGAISIQVFTQFLPDL